MRLLPYAQTLERRGEIPYRFMSQETPFAQETKTFVSALFPDILLQEQAILLQEQALLATQRTPDTETTGDSDKLAALKGAIAQLQQNLEALSTKLSELKHK